MVTLVRPRTAALMLSLDADGDPRDSDLTLATRDGEVVWRGQVGQEAWRAGLRLRTRCQSTWHDAHWLLTRMLLETELAAHGLGRDGPPDLDVRITGAPDGVMVTTTCRVIPVARYPLLVDTTLDAVSWSAGRQLAALSAPATRPAARALRAAPQGAGTA
ncbi:hypothetical protein [Cellulomonas aerilata]|uniref:Uncharacterized protein n=1 Tax=Cellulomonas aerilata TaxID=515326 RepID=A0A512DCU0_9CELL|nr:hypothetical protein [Cellulomonas aerilata]GEO34247.1 hypothetical protein CAE01nite_19720 [Cellulomonas aerilata]